MKKTLLIASLLTSVLAVAGTTGSVEFNNNTKSTVTNFTKDGVKDAITGSEFDTALKGNVTINDLFAAGFEIGTKSSFDGFTVSKDTLLKHGDPSLWFEVMKDGNFLKATLKPHKVDKDKAVKGKNGDVVEGYLLTADDQLYQGKETVYVLRPAIELNLQKSIDDLTFKANAKSEFNVISNKITGEKLSPVVKESSVNTDRKVESNPTYVDPTLSFDFNASKGDLNGVKDATADVTVNLKGEKLGFANAGLALSGSYDLNKLTNMAVAAKVDYKNQGVKSIIQEITDKFDVIKDSKAKNGTFATQEDVAKVKESIEGFFGTDDTKYPTYKDFKEKVLDSKSDAVKAYYANLKDENEAMSSLYDVYYNKVDDALDRKLDLGKVNQSYALDATYKLGDQLSLGSSAYLYHGYFNEDESLVNVVLGATLNADVNAFHFGTEVKGLAMEHVTIDKTAQTLAVRAKANTSYKFKLAEGLTLTPSISGNVVVAKLTGLDSAVQKVYKKVDASLTPKVSLDFMKNGFSLGISLESAYNFSNKHSLDEYFTTRKDDEKVSFKGYKEDKAMNSFGFINNVFKAGLTLGYNW